jgi:hypothetical protein
MLKTLVSSEMTVCRSGVTGCLRTEPQAEAVRVTTFVTQLKRSEILKEAYNPPSMHKQYKIHYMLLILF